MKVVKDMLLCIMITGLAISTALAKNSVKNSVVKIYTVNNRYNYHEPWQMHGQDTFQGSGCIIAGNRILTNAHVVSDQTFVQARRAGMAKKFTAEIEIIAHECDLAILKIKDPTFFRGIKPLPIGDLPEIRDKVAVYGFPEGGDKLSITEGVVSRIEHTNYAHSRAYLLTCQIDAPINSGNSGGPVIKDDKIVGVAFQGMLGELYQNIGYMVPVPVINHFLKDIEDGKYHGTPDLGISMQKMENPDLRASYFLKRHQTGVLVNKIYPESPSEGVLQSGDVILYIDDIPIDNDGTIEFREGERTYFGYVIQKKNIDDIVTLSILRGGKQKSVQIRLTKPMDFERLVPNQRYEVEPTYYITGGLVFEPLTLNYLGEYGSGGGDWSLNAPTELVNFYLNGEPSKHQRETVIMVKVLADEVNVGYHDSENVVISSVNGKKISTMVDLVKAFESHKGQYHIIEDIRGYKRILGRKKVGENNRRILDKYKIKSDRSKNLFGIR